MGRQCVFYWYMLAGTCGAFLIFGFILGRQADQVEEKMRKRMDL